MEISSARINVRTVDQALAPTRRAAPGTALAYAGLLVVILVAIVGLQPFDVPSAVQNLSGEGDVLRQVSYVAAFCLLLVSSQVPSSRLLSFNLPLLVVLLLIWSGFSVVWAIEPSIASRRFGLTAIIVAAVFMGVDRLGVDGAINMLRRLLPILLVLNYIAVLALPHAIHGADEIDHALVGNWRGLLDHKNVAGPLCVVTILALMFLPQGRKYVRFALLIAAAVFLFKTQSKTSMALLLPAIAFGLIIYYLKASHRIVLAVFLTLMVLIVVLYTGVISSISEYVSEPDSLTGRTVIWAVLFEYASKNLLLGAGFGSFWNVGLASPVFQLSGQQWVAGISSGHNGYLDLLVQIGVPGLLLAVLATMVVPMWIIFTDARLPRHLAAFCGSVLVFFIGQNFSESSLFDRDANFWIYALVVLALLQTARVAAKNQHIPQMPVHYA